MDKRTKILEGNLFSTGHLAISDIHNGGNVFGCIYLLTLDFGMTGNVELYPKIVFNSGLSEWRDSVLKMHFNGTRIAKDKHVNLDLQNDQTGEKCQAYIETINSDLIIGEFYFENRSLPLTYVFEKIG